LQSICNRFAIGSIGLQSMRNRFVFTVQSVCDWFAIDSQSVRNRFAIDSQSVRNRVGSQSVRNRFAFTAQSILDSNFLHNRCTIDSLPCSAHGFALLYICSRSLLLLLSTIIPKLRSLSLAPQHLPTHRPTPSLSNFEILSTTRLKLISLLFLSYFHTTSASISKGETANTAICADTHTSSKRRRETGGNERGEGTGGNEREREGTRGDEKGGDKWGAESRGELSGEQNLEGS
jgi:hypothetical protein